jgi:ABC-type bacteriocin/lantibiotic exporter with double-glycine peptidase domain
LSPVLVSLITIGLYQYLHQSFKISVLLMGLAIFSAIQDPIRYVPALINGLIDAKNSLNRIEKFIRQPEINENILKQCEFDENKDYSILIENGYFSWGVKQKKN